MMLGHLDSVILLVFRRLYCLHGSDCVKGKQGRKKSKLKAVPMRISNCSSVPKYRVHRRRSSRHCSRRRCDRRCRSENRRRSRNEPNSDRIDHCFHRNFLRNRNFVAARKNEVDMALGNAIGSNIFNILMVLGIASAISPMAIITENIIDLCVLIVFTVCVWIFAGTKRKSEESKVSVWSHFMPHMPFISL